ncbi:sulfite exporter TauE/SafE family protein [Membranihabitans marinus]|uniref:sulfite exporter TauE/SafE family protein n=1 Tax=Membranihabitans marinus TaxID=1227546 RepID=UPI001F1BF3CC|nr:sulfite exporter TauE/SafE family protein [Membranihabitans marinus]
MDTILLITALGICLGFFVQSMIGFAGALVALPVLLTVMSMPDAIATISLFYLFSSVEMVIKNWKNIQFKIILKLTLVSIVGIGLGIYVLSFSKPLFLKKILGVFILMYVIYSLLKYSKDIRLPKLTIPLGFLGGFFSGLFSTGGPLYVMSVRNTVTDSKSIRATMIGILALVSLVRVPMLSINGILTKSHLQHSIIILPFFFAAQFLGTKAYGKLNENSFKNILLLLLAISGIFLIIR